MREFVAFDIEDRTILEEVFQDDLMHDRCARPARTGEMHLTYAFLGEIDPSLNEEIADVVSNAAHTVGRYRVEFRGVGAFPSAARPSVIWVGVRDNGESLKMHALLREGLGKLDLRLDERPFHPHMTLARVKCRISPGLLESFFGRWANHYFGSQEVSEVVLKKSELKEGGAEHTVLHASRL